MVKEEGGNWYTSSRIERQKTDRLPEGRVVLPASPRDN